MKLTPAEQHIAEQSERRDLTSICQRLARIEDRMTAVERRAAFAHKANDETMQHVESVKRSLEGAHESIERLMNRIAPDLLPMPQPDPMPGFELGAKLRRQVEEDMATICGQEPLPHAQWTGAELERAQKDWARETAAGFNRVAPFVRSAQDTYNRRMSEILARAAADIERANAYYALVDRLHRGFGVRQTGRQAGVELDALWKALGSPLRPGEQPPEGHDRTQEDDYGREG